MYSTFVIAPVPVGMSMDVMSRQIRCPALNWFAVARICIRYSTTSSGFTGAIASRVSLWNGSHCSLHPAMPAGSEEERDRAPHMTGDFGTKALEVFTAEGSRED